MHNPHDIGETDAPALDFVRQLAIEVAGSGRLWRAGSPAAFEEDRPLPACAFVAGASVAAFTDGIYGQQREDLLNSTLLAQLAANQRYALERDTVDWYAWYRRVLLKLGWQLAPKREPKRLQLVGQVAGPSRVNALQFAPFRPVIVEQPRFSADDTALALLRNKVDSAAAHATAAAVEKLRSLDQRDRRTQIFESSAHQGASGSFQIISASAVSEQLLSMTIAALFFATSEQVPRLLGFHFGRSTTTMQQACDTLTLIEADYAPLRAQVIEQLGDQAAAYIDEIDLA